MVVDGVEEDEDEDGRAGMAFRETEPKCVLRKCGDVWGRNETVHGEVRGKNISSRSEVSD